MCADSTITPKKWTFCVEFRARQRRARVALLAMRTRFRLLALPFSTLLVGCGPDKRPEEPCDGPSFNLVVTAEDGPLPPDTRINVRSGSNQTGEAYELGQQARGQAVFCEEDTTSPDAEGGASQGGAAATDAESRDVYALRCRLYTQGPARLEATATGYQAIEDEPLSFEKKPYCEVSVNVRLERELPDAGK
jgi:hypothetical protein